MDVILALNQTLFFTIFNLSKQNSLLDGLMIFGATELIFLVLAFVVWLLFEDRKLFFLIAFSFIVGFTLLKVVELFVLEPRPFSTFAITPLIPVLPDDSFPSDHTLIIAIVATANFFIRTRFRWLLVFLTFWTGLARIYTGVHYPIDVLGGILLAVAAVSLSWEIEKIVFTRVLKLK